MNNIRTYFLFFYITCANILLFSQAEDPKTVNNFYMNQNNNNQSASSATVNEVITSIKKINWPHPQDYAKGAYGSLKHYLQTTILQHKIRTCLIIMGSAYAFTYAQLAHSAYKLDSSDSWTLWKRSYTLEELLGMPQLELAQELLIAVQKRYSTVDDLYDFITPLVSFINHTDHEIKLCKKFLNLHSWIKWTRLTFLFPTHEQLKAQAHEKINRLAYLKSLLLNWLSEHKIAMNKPKKQVDQNYVTP